MASSTIYFGFLLTILLGIFIEIQADVISMDEQQCIYARRDSEFKDFYPLLKIRNSQMDGFKAIVRVAVTSDYGYAHILLSESNDGLNSNKGYEFALSPWDDAEIRRRDNVYGKYEVVAKSDYNVKEYAPNVTNLEVSISSSGMVKILDLTSNATVTFNDPVPLDVNFISFSARSKFEFNCDYGVFSDNTLFIQTRCESIFGWREELFHPLTSVSSSQPEGYKAKVNISMLSDYGDIHVLLSEKNAREKENPCYEIVIGDRFKTQSEFRRKNSIFEAYDFEGQKVFDYNMKERRSHQWMEISVSNDGVVSFKDLDRKLEFNYTDSQANFPLNYITFGGYRKYPATYQINCMEAETKC